MRTLVSCLFALAAVPVFAAGSMSYDNARYGYAIGIPDGFTPQGESASGDGQVFETDDGTKWLTVWGGYLLEDFASELAERRAGYESDGWSITYAAETPTWVSFSGTRGGHILYVRAVAGCQGNQYAMFELTYSKSDAAKIDPIVDPLVRSLRQVDCP